MSVSNGMMAMLVIAIILLVDQIVKIWVKTNMCIGETFFQWDAFGITWFRMTFLENNGAAGGLQLFGSKVFLTLFRLVAIGFVGYEVARHHAAVARHLELAEVNPVFRGERHVVSACVFVVPRGIK